MANILRILRRAKQKTQLKLAQQVGVNVSVINRLEKELDLPEPRIVCTFATAVRIARALDVDPAELFPVPMRESGPKRRGRPSAKHRQRLKQAKASTEKELDRAS